MRGLSLDRVVDAAATLKEKGWREMKTQLALPGETTPAIEVERMRRVREAIGPDIKLMCDINQRLAGRTGDRPSAGASKIPGSVCSGSRM